MSTKFLSKSRFMSGQQCELKLWYDAYRRDLATPPSEQQQSLLALLNFKWVKHGHAG